MSGSCRQAVAGKAYKPLEDTVMNESSPNYNKSIFMFIMMGSFVLLAAVLKVTASVFIPLVVAVLLAFVFYPFCKKMSTFHIPWIVSILLLIVLSLVVMYFAGNLLVTSCKAIVNAYPRYEARFSSLIQLFIDTFNIHYDENSSLLTNLLSSSKVQSTVQNAALSLSNFIVSAGKVIFLVILLVVFLLIELRTLHKKVDTAFPKKAIRQKIGNIAGNTIREVTHFISIKFFISLITGILVFLSCLVMNMDFPIIWGFLAFVLNFIPNFGSILSWVITVVFAILQFYPSWGKIVFIAVAVLAINMILGNIIEPRWEGSDLGLSPFVILVSLSFWGWMWGFVGMILAVPMMVIIKIVCENVDILHPVAVLLGNPRSVTRMQEAHHNQGSTDRKSTSQENGGLPSEEE